MKNDEVFTSLTEAAKYAHVCRQAIFLAIKKKKLKAVQKKFKGQMQWVILKQDLDEYRADKYNRDKCKIEGELIIDLDQDRWSVAHAAKTLSSMLRRPYPAAHLYYLLRLGELRASKKGGRWVISKKELIDLYQKELKGFASYKQIV
jgi:hypothetical protein